MKSLEKPNVHYYEIAPIGIFRGDQEFLTYHSETSLDIGNIVLIEVGKQKKLGLVLRTATKPRFTTKSVLKIVNTTQYPKHLIELAMWISEYYATKLGTTLQNFIPAGLTKKRRTSHKSHSHPIRKRTNILLTDEQKATINKISNADHGTFVINGVTGSGKTEVYIQSAKQVVKQGKSVIVLVPEISLTSQLVADFSHHFDNLTVTHSRLSEADRHKIWTSVLNSNDPQVVIGPRSALFMPVPNLGMVIVDEFHEPSYKQDKSPKYSAIRVASVLTKLTKSKVIFGSATPSTTDLFVAQELGATLIYMRHAISAKSDIDIKPVNMKDKANFTKHWFLSDILINEVTSSLNQNKQVLLFHNRRGSASVLICSECGWNMHCTHCFLPLTLHADKNIMKCHICSIEQKIPKVCLLCNEPTIIFKGIGTKLIESEIRKLFPKTSIARFDSDNTLDETLTSKYQDVHDGKIQIIIGTQNIAKGLDLPKLQTVGVIQADNGLLMPDYSAEERVFQLLYQVLGRVGRAGKKGSVIVQAFNLENPIIRSAIDRDFDSFYEEEIKKRRQQLMPPFRFLLKLTCSYKTEATAYKNAEKLAKQINEDTSDIEVLGPSPAFYERFGGEYRWQLTIKSKKRSSLLTIIRNLPSNWQYDLDPQSLL